MSLWGLLAQGIQDTTGHIFGFATGTHETQQAQHAMNMSDQQYQLEKERYAHQRGMDELNYRHMLDKYEYDKALQQKIFDREDNSVQRRTADLKAAGINPILAAGAGAGAGAPVATTAPMHHATAQTPNISPKMQAAQMAMEMRMQQKARSIQLSNMIAHLNLLTAQAKDTEAASRVKGAEEAEIRERTKGYSGQRGLTEASTQHHYTQIKELYNRMSVTPHQIQKVQADTEGARIHNAEAARNFKIARDWGIRSDIKDSTVFNDIIQAMGFMINAYGTSDYKEAWTKLKSEVGKALNEISPIQSPFPAIREGLSRAGATAYSWIEEDIEGIREFAEMIRTTPDRALNAIMGFLDGIRTRTSPESTGRGQSSGRY